MSIDAKIVGTSRHADGTVTIALEPRERGGCAGQQVMTILNPPPLDCDLSRLIGVEIWGGDGYVLVGDEKLADRVGYTSLRLVDGWVPIVSKWTINRMWNAAD